MKEAMADIGPTALTSVLSLVALFALTKLMGCKQVSQLTLFDYIIGITIGSIAAELATELEEPVQPLTALIIYGLVAFGISELATKSVRARSFINGKPLVLLDAGQIYRKNLRKARLDLNEFLTQCRAAGYFDLSQVQTALMEHNGSVSFLPKEPHRPATPSDMDLRPKQSQVQTPFVMDGKLHSRGGKGGDLGPQGADEAGLSGRERGVSRPMGWGYKADRVSHGDRKASLLTRRVRTLYRDSAARRWWIKCLPAESARRRKEPALHH